MLLLSFQAVKLVQLAAVILVCLGALDPSGAAVPVFRMCTLAQCFVWPQVGHSSGCAVQDVLRVAASGA